MGLWEKQVLRETCTSDSNGESARATEPHNDTLDGRAVVARGRCRDARCNSMRF